MAPDLAHRQAAGIQRQHPRIEALEVPGALRHDRRLERAVTIPRRRDRHLALVRQHRLVRVPVAAVAAAAARRVSLLVTQMVGQRRRQRPLQQRLLQLAEQPVITQQILRPLVVGQKLIQQRGS